MGRRALDRPGEVLRHVPTMNHGAVALTLLLVAVTTGAYAEGDAPIEGVYTQNELCQGNGSQQPALRVQMGASEISYAGGTCSIDSRRESGPSLTMQVTCKFKSGAVLGSVVTFTRKDNNTFDMAQQDGTYKAVLHRCPG